MKEGLQLTFVIRKEGLQMAESRFCLMTAKKILQIYYMLLFVIKH